MDEESVLREQWMEDAMTGRGVAPSDDAPPGKGSRATDGTTTTRLARRERGWRRGWSRGAVAGGRGAGGRRARPPPSRDAWAPRASPRDAACRGRSRGERRRLWRIARKESQSTRATDRVSST